MGLSARAAREAKRVADECARGVLEVSLNAAELSNLQKAHLLDVLLWASDIPVGTPPRFVPPGQGTWKPPAVMQVQ